MIGDFCSLGNMFFFSEQWIVGVPTFHDGLSGNSRGSVPGQSVTQAVITEVTSFLLMSQMSVYMHQAASHTKSH